MNHGVYYGGQRQHAKSQYKLFYLRDQGRLHHINDGANASWKKWGGMVFTAFFQEYRGREVYCSINFLCKLIIFHTGIGQHKDVWFAEKINALARPLSFCKIPPNLIIYWQNTVSYSTVKIVHCTVARRVSKKICHMNIIFDFIN